MKRITASFKTENDLQESNIKTIIESLNGTITNIKTEDNDN